MLLPEYKSFFRLPFFLKFLICISLITTHTEYSGSLPAYSQIFDSIQFSLQKKPQLTGGFGTKNTFINGFRSPVFTAHIGLDFNHRVKAGAGISWLKLPPFENKKDNTPFYINKVLGADTVNIVLQFRYMNVFLEYVYFITEKWEFSIPIQIGIGDSRYKYNYGSEKIVENKHLIFLYEPSVSGQYKITKWFGAGLDVGYRLMLIDNKNIGGKFNSPVYDIRIIVFWGEFYKVL